MFNLYKCSDILEKATAQPEKFIDNKDFIKYLNIQVSESGNYCVDVKKVAIAAAKKVFWLVIIDKQ